QPRRPSGRSPARAIEVLGITERARCGRARHRGPDRAGAGAGASDGGPLRGVVPPGPADVRDAFQPVRPAAQGPRRPGRRPGRIDGGGLSPLALRLVGDQPRLPGAPDAVGTPRGGDGDRGALGLRAAGGRAPDGYQRSRRGGTRRPGANRRPSIGAAPPPAVVTNWPLAFADATAGAASTLSANSSRRIVRRSFSRRWLVVRWFFSWDSL